MPLPAQVTCSGQQTFCTASAASCGRAGCVDDAACVDGEGDCVCPDCAQASFCMGTLCTDNGVCDSDVDGCIRADCAAHPAFAAP
jgi:hypothetical protein